jgi:hypothetical protein
MARPKRISERLVALFLLGVVLMFPPVLGVFNQQLRPFGVPLLYLYLFVAWAALILLTATVVRSIGADDNGAADADVHEAPRGEERADA